ncbi:hypothetical protein [Candidatus Bodocaedibacter vickermanii]|uniref:Uncharacterized protein n=1 Tax=Candidatus Bodocaedibacter vickermanii TaxID=2741701 RepID=A0A7L9RTQ7_9PROT|nr:hypothetical protein CPBP_00672 [Candidatus Paracaedibacteraceae bacterium 'Lake Konstanz']
MRKIIIIICFALTGIFGDVQGAAVYSVGNFAEVSESTRNLFEGYIRCGSLLKPLVPTSKTPLLIAINTIATYSRDIEAKVKQVKALWGKLGDILGGSFSDECRIANPTLNLSFEKACEILELLRIDLAVWLAEYGAFPPG